LREDKTKKQLSHKEYRKDLAVLRIRLLVTQTALLKKRLAYTRKEKRLAGYCYLNDMRIATLKSSIK
jgi:hypothetical protein